MPTQNKSINKNEISFDGKKPIILLIHGFPFDHKMYESVSLKIASVCDVIAPDLIGFGKQENSEDQTSIRTMSDFADQIEMILQYLGVQRPIILCGLSMGGYISMEFVRHYSSRLAGLILCDTKTIPDSAEAASNRLKLADSISSEKLPAIADQMISNLLCEETFAKSPQVVDFLRKMILRQPINGIAAASRGMANRVDTTDLLRTITVPVLLICGDQDALSPPKSMIDLKESIAAQNPSTSIEFVSIPNCGHLPPLEQPEIFAQTIIDFVKKTTSAS